MPFALENTFYVSKKLEFSIIFINFINYLIINSIKQPKNKEKKPRFYEPSVNITSSFNKGIFPQYLISISANFQSYGNNAYPASTPSL